MRVKSIALVAHDNKKDELARWAKFNKEILKDLDIYATGTTGRILEKELDLKVIKLQSGPLGGDLQLGAKISEGDIDMLVFFWDPLEPQPHDPDVKALLRIGTVWNIPIATNIATADFIISSKLMKEDYDRHEPEYRGYKQQKPSTE